MLAIGICALASVSDEAVAVAPGKAVESTVGGVATATDVVAGGGVRADGAARPATLPMASRPPSSARSSRGAVIAASPPPSRWLDEFDHAGCDGTIAAIAPLPDGRVVVGGQFESCGDVVVNGVAIWDPAAAAFVPMGAGLGSGFAPVDALAVSGNSIFVGGAFAQTGNIAANAIARFDLATQTWSSLGFGPGDGLNGAVLAIAVHGQSLFAGGMFTEAGGAPVPYLARFDFQSQTWGPVDEAAGASVSGFVYALWVDGNDLIVGGDFERAGGIVVNNIARLDTTTRTWAPFGSGVGQSVRAIAVAGGHVYVGGSMVSAGTQVVNHLARFDRTNGTWRAVGRGAVVGTNNWVQGLAATEDSLYVVGSFERAGGLQASRVARFDLGSEQWEPLAGGGSEGLDGVAYAVARVGDRILVGGNFDSAGAERADSIAGFDTSTGQWIAFRGQRARGVSWFANSFVEYGDDVIVGGTFRWAGDVAASSVARYDTVNRSWSPLADTVGEGVDGWVNSLELVGTQLFVGGYFTRAGGRPARNIARYDLASRTWSPIGHGSADGVDGMVTALEYSDGMLYVGGGFASAGTVPAYGLARLDLSTGTWGTLGEGDSNGVGGFVEDLLVHRGSLFVGGGFVSAGGEVRSKLARFELATQAWAAFNAGFDAGPEIVVTALAAWDDVLVAGGRFPSAGGVPAYNIARLNLDTGTWSSLGVGSANGVRSTVTGTVVSGIVERDGRLYVAGNFDLAGGEEANYIARYDLMRQAWESVDDRGAIGVNDVAAGLHAVGANLYVGGVFSRAGRVVSAGLARYDDRRDVSISLAVGDVPVTANSLASLSGTVTSGGFSSPAGTVTFVSDENVIEGCRDLPLKGTGPERTAVCTTRGLRVGQRQIEVGYSGDALNYVAQSSRRSLEVVAPDLVVVPESLPNADLGIDYRVALGVSGEGATLPIAFSVVSGALPPGLSLRPDGVIDGVPSTTGLFTFRVAGTDSSTTSASGGPFTAFADLALAVGTEVTFRNGFE